MYKKTTKFVLLVCGILFLINTPAYSATIKIGVVLLHGDSRPNIYIQPLKDKLTTSGMLVLHPELPYSLNRRFDKDVNSAIKQVDDAFAKLKAQGASKLFLVAHSKGGVFATYYASTHKLDGLVVISPGATVTSRPIIRKLGDSIEKAKEMIASGKGNQESSFSDLEASRGVDSFDTTAEAYYSWFDPNGAMNLDMSVSHLSSNLPILWIVGQNDYPIVRWQNIPRFKTLPKNSNTEFYEPDATHKTSPRVSEDKIVSWIHKVAAQ